MNIYFSPAIKNEINFPTSNLSTSITSGIKNIDEEIEANFGVSETLNEDQEKSDEISKFYARYRSEKSLFDQTAAQKKLNKIKVYFIVKSKTVGGQKVNYAVPIRTFETLGNSIIERSGAFIASIFYLKVDNVAEGYEYIEGRPGARPFRLDEVIHSEPPYDAEQEFSLERFILPKEYDLDKAAALDFLDREKDEIEIDDKGYFLGEELVQEFYDDFTEELYDLRTLLYFLSKYEYNDSMIDNTILVNSSNYDTDPKSKKSLGKGKNKANLISSIREFNFREEGLKFFSISNFVSFVLGDPSALVDKNIIPVFSDLEDAEDLLITTLEEINQPFQVRRRVESSSTPEYSRSLNYLDDSFSLQNRYFFPDSGSKLEMTKDFLRTHRFIKSQNLAPFFNDKYYHEDQYQTKGPFFVEDTESVDNDVYVPMSQQPKFAPKCIWREVDYWAFLDYYFPGQPEAYSWWESRDMSDSDKGLLQKSQDLKIISMGLGDFLEFWNNPTEKSAEILFIPSSDNFVQRKIPFLNNKPSDKFYEYQQRFRGSRKQDTNKYSYDIKVLPE